MVVGGGVVVVVGGGTVVVGGLGVVVVVGFGVFASVVKETVVIKNAAKNSRVENMNYPHFDLLTSLRCNPEAGRAAL